MNRIGPVTKRRLALVAELKELAQAGGYLDRCEIGPILRNRGITFVRCQGPLTFAHSVKCSKRGKDAVLDREVARACTLHHYTYLDLLAPERTAEIVREAIARRTNV